MARIQILNLPGDGQPFALVIDQADESMLAWTDTEGLAEHIGARCVLVFDGAVEIAGQQPAPPAEAAAPEALWEKAADRNGELYAACENQRDELREVIARVRNIPAVPQSMDASNRWPPDYLAGYRNALQIVQRAIDQPPVQAAAAVG